MRYRLVPALSFLALVGCTNAANVLVHLPTNRDDPHAEGPAPASTGRLKLTTLGLVSLEVNSLHVQMDPTKQYDGTQRLGVFTFTSTDSAYPTGAAAYYLKPAPDGDPTHLIQVSPGSAWFLLYSNPAAFKPSDWKISLGTTPASTSSVTAQGWLEASFPSAATGDLFVRYDLSLHPSDITMLIPSSGYGDGAYFILGAGWSGLQNPALTKTGTASATLDVRDLNGTAISGLTADYFWAGLSAPQNSDPSRAGTRIQSVSETATGSYRMQLRIWDMLPDNLAYTMEIGPSNKSGKSMATFFRR